jgi:hypothetical protein
LQLWIKKQLRKIDKNEGRQSKGHPQSSKDLMMEFLNWLEKEADNAEGLGSTLASEVDRPELSKKDFDRIMRVKLRKFRKNSEGHEVA